MQGARYCNSYNSPGEVKGVMWSGCHIPEGAYESTCHRKRCHKHALVQGFQKSRTLDGYEATHVGADCDVQTRLCLSYVCLTTPPLPPLSLSRHLLPQPELYTKVKQRTLLCSRAGRQASSISLISTTIYYSLAKAPPSPLSSKPCCADCWSST